MPQKLVPRFQGPHFSTARHITHDRALRFSSQPSTHHRRGDSRIARRPPRYCQGFVGLDLARYFIFVAMPPRICLSARFVESISETLINRSKSRFFNRRETSLCTVDLLIPNLSAAARTVAPVSAIYFPSITTLSSISFCKTTLFNGTSAP